MWHTTGEGKNQGHMTCTGLRYGRENWDEVGVVGCSSRGRSTCRTHTAARSQLPPLAGADAERCQAASSGSPRMCAVFSVHGCLWHRLRAGGGGEPPPPLPPGAATPSLSAAQPQGSAAACRGLICCSARALQVEAAWDSEVWIGTGRSWLPAARAAHSSHLWPQHTC